MIAFGAQDEHRLPGRPPRPPSFPPAQQEFTFSDASLLSSRDRPWYPGQPLPPQERPSRALLEASLAAGARAGVSAPLPAAMTAVAADADDWESPAPHRAPEAASRHPPPRQPASPAPSPCALQAGARAGAEAGAEYPLTPAGDAARSALVDEILRACEPGDPVLAAVCRLLRSVLGVPMASVTLISHAQAWFRGGEGGSPGGGASGGGASGGGGGGGGGGSCSAAAAAAAAAAEGGSPGPRPGPAAAGGGDPGPMPRGRVLCAYSLIGEPDVRWRGIYWFLLGLLSFPSFFSCSLSLLPPLGRAALSPLQTR